MLRGDLDPNCAFFEILRSANDASRVFEDDFTLASLHHRPLFPGHCLVIPKTHLETMEDLSESVLTQLFSTVRMLAAAIELGMRAEGTFVAANNRVSQSVSHFHVHVVPRRKGYGLKDFSGGAASTKMRRRSARFWPHCVQRLRKCIGVEAAGAIVACRHSKPWRSRVILDVIAEP